MARLSLTFVKITRDYDKKAANVNKQSLQCKLML